MLNTPNILSLIRLCLVPVFVITYFSGIGNAKLWAAIIYALATFTDYLDGHLARKYKLITNLGKVLDPLGDKMLTFAVLACLSLDGIIPGWIVMIYFTKEILMGMGGLLIHRRARVEIPPSNMLGKVATVLFFLICVVLMLVDVGHTVSMLLISVAVLVSLAAFVSYLVRYLAIMKNRRKSKE